MTEELVPENIQAPPVPEQAVETAPAPVPEPTAQPVEPLATEPVSEPQLEPEPSLAPAPQVSTPQAPTPRDNRSLLAKARDVIQFRKRKKLDKIMGLFLKKPSITNDDVEKLLHVSDATATRYLAQLEREGKIKQAGTAKGSVYSRI